jgi:hypothetical protein
MNVNVSGRLNTTDTDQEQAVDANGDKERRNEIAVGVALLSS